MHMVAIKQASESVNFRLYFGSSVSNRLFDSVIVSSTMCKTCVESFVLLYTVKNNTDKRYVSKKKTCTIKITIVLKIYDNCIRLLKRNQI